MWFIIAAYLFIMLPLISILKHCSERFALAEALLNTEGEDLWKESVRGFNMATLFPHVSL
ncbi:uncharacterized protein CYBJADRAFT_165674 [Cyberlindnera jadinii NRRL Y-1542]|uniref:Uncharacterized protein n=1 Tax=Cyberlindnera jadinii (strain ATCC 18201 / CBS 1600 / BCRC 20928 / JCM 3617 / NBRC 0987 / NRRL Y-1542) TaxID=983966 RepID=A0A1E4SAE9_CYBJN|nr:hypothetical protein CYBJADRAFT_165674 [Cyberlindnera jadinii NRRL Y-1542]ODV76382.1 hypothetical protein CYBJADRAFT_165674 [Cyberlindnera jadinii NRRL Y-1542]